MLALQFVVHTTGRFIVPVDWPALIVAALSLGTFTLKGAPMVVLFPPFVLLFFGGVLLFRHVARRRCSAAT